MNPLDTGLRHRVRRAGRQIATQHARLRTLRHSLAAAAEAGDVAEVSACLERLRGAIDAHFALEEGVFFPAVHGLHPDSTPVLNSLADEHRDRLADLDRLRDELAGGTLAGFARFYRDFSEATADHEGREERLIESLADLIDSARS